MNPAVNNSVITKATDQIAVPDILDSKSASNLQAFIRSYLDSSISPIKVKCGVTTQATDSSGKLTFAHNLGVVPNLYSVSSEAWKAAGTGNVNMVYVDPANPPDATNFYLLSPNGTSASISFSYVAAYIPNNG